MKVRNTFAMQRRIQHASLSVEAAFFAWSAQNGYKEEFT
jgi:hypothetical protein